ncbi:MAG: hypothetical protein AVDCRST_MAG91-78 [uncultured Sphingomonadaceae bacterium]|uniref:L,D-TPase catalytic domain-containing protein n=1 Tax=uncultured Sphingomonadaceae bacterium TaxID=169976 RepID=A0A6J4RUP9_9SPHN|nr:MAG: hypothetical protein AVDCRST_MAG91-78 [uncultured Sphingomonadaceae bacterium]
MRRRGPARIALRVAATTGLLLGVAAVGGQAANSGQAMKSPIVAEAQPRDDSSRIVFPRRNLPRLSFAGPRTRQVRSLLNVRGPMEYGQFIWNEEGVPSGPVWVRVDLGGQTISIFRAGHEIGTAVVLYGADEKPTPVGRFTVLGKFKDHRSSIYDAPMPYTLRLTHDGIAIHGSNVRRNAATHGCVGVPTAFAALLFGQLKVGNEVAIVRGGSGSSSS